MNYKDRVVKRIVEHVKSNYQKINKNDMQLGDLYFNYRCHMNAVQYIKTNKADEVYLCVYIEDNYPIVHFINKKEDKYIDNTLGWYYEQLDYYIIKRVSEEEYINIWDLLTDTQKNLIEANSNTILRKMCGIKFKGLI